MSSTAEEVGKGAAILLWLCVIAGLVVGWIMNIMAIVHLPVLSQWGGMAVARILGTLVFPLGAILGYV